MRGVCAPRRQLRPAAARICVKPSGGFRRSAAIYDECLMERHPPEVRGWRFFDDDGWGFTFCCCVADARRRSCAAYGCDSSLVAASGGQGGPGGLRFPPRPSLDSPLPLKTPPLRYGAVAAGAGRCAAGAGSVGALRRISAVVWEAAGAGRCAAGAGSISALRRISAVV